jgi:sterol desaturase/sphingolipid hydroxylase (fatty acid hydroxylase superfamily)
MFNTTIDFAIYLSIFLILNFLVFSVFGTYFFYGFLASKIKHRQIIDKLPTKKIILKESKRSFRTMFIFLIQGIVLYKLYKNGNTLIFDQWNKYGILYFAANFLMIQLLNDAYFYWSHRAMHQISWLKKYHVTHHKSHAPSPFSALSFHPVEAFIHGFFWIIVSVIIPTHPIWLAVFYSFMYYINMWGHTNFEFWHKDLLTHPILKHLNTPTHHILHHKYHDKNYSIYYNFWDNICSTNHKNYAEDYRAVKSRSEKSKTSKLLKYMKL